MKLKIQLTSDALRKWIRTFVPIGLGSLVAWLIAKVAPASAPSLIGHLTHGGLFALLMAITSSSYAGLFIWLEKHFKWASAFLGALPHPKTVSDPAETPTEPWTPDAVETSPASDPASAGASSQAP